MTAKELAQKFDGEECTDMGLLTAENRAEA